MGSIERELLEEGFVRLVKGPYSISFRPKAQRGYKACPDASLSVEVFGQEIFLTSVPLNGSVEIQEEQARQALRTAHEKRDGYVDERIAYNLDRIAQANESIERATKALVQLNGEHVKNK